MKFSGHETFAIREGWLHKGLKLLIKEPELLYDEYVADWLGVGKNMARSIRHWLEVTGLAERERRMQPVDWMRNHYDMIHWRDQHAA